MASTDDYAAWIVANQAKRGTPEFEVVARAYQEAKGAPETPPNPTEGGLPFRPLGINTGLEMPQGVSRFMAGAGKGFTDIGRGVSQLFDKPTVSSLITGKTPLQAEIDESRRLDAPLMNTGAGFAGNVAGNIAATAPAMFVPGANTVVGGAALGAGLGAIQPVATDESRLQNVGAGAVGGALVPAAGAALRTGRALAEPLYERGRATIAGRLLNRVAGDNAPAVQQRMAMARELVPGSQPTAAEVAESGGVAAVQRMAAGADPEAYAQRGMEQANARLNALRGIARDPQAMDAAVTARRAASAPLFAQSERSVVPVDAALDDVLARPSVSTAMARAQRLADERGVTIALPGRAERTVASNVLDASGKPFPGTTIPGQAAQISGRGVQYLKMALDDMLDNPRAAGIGAHEAAALRDTRSRLIAWADNAIPEYGQANAAFRAGSRPINQMQVGQELLERIQPALADHGALGRETGARYAQALRNSEQTARTATGFGRNALEQVMEPGQMQTLNAVGQDLARKATAQDLGRGTGSNTFQNFAMDNLAQQSGMPAATSFLLNLPGVSRAASWVYRETDARTRAQLAQALLNPRDSAMLMRQAQGNPRLAAALREIQRIGVSGGAALALPNAQQQ